jgi:death-on-curing protein
MAAAYLFHIVKNHAFEDGNKRTGVQAAIVFLDINGFRFDLTQDEVVMLGLDVAEDRMNKERAAAFFRAKLNEA